MTFFDKETMQRIRFLHYSIKKIEDALEKEEEDFDLDDLNLILEYTMILNINYQNANHKKILSELEITQIYHDPKDKKDIEIYDLMFECCRVLWVLARSYAQLAEGYEENESWDNAITAMYESSKIYKAAAYFSTASVHQYEKGTTLIGENLELNSEEARTLAQSIGTAREKKKNNLYFCSKLYAGLSAMSKRIFYLKKHKEKKKQQIRAQFHYDMGQACELKARATVESSLTNIKSEKVKKLKQKALFYYSKSQKIWNSMLKNIKGLSPEEKESIEINAEVVDELIEDLDVEELPYNEIKRILDPEPVVLIPENLAPFVPKSTVYLTKFVPKDVNIRRFNKFKKKKLEKKIPYSKKEKLLDKKAGLIRTINELKMMKENKEIDADKFAELMEKYSIKLQMADTAIEKLSK